MSWQHFYDTKPIARKPHRCYLCGEAIEIREKHVRRTGVREGRIDSIRMHIECCKHTDANFDEMDWECFFEGDLPRPAREKS